MYKVSLHTQISGVCVSEAWDEYLADGGEFDIPDAVVTEVPHFRGELHMELAKDSCLPHCVRPVLPAHLLGEQQGVCVCVCVCVSESESESMCVCVCVCV